MEVFAGGGDQPPGRYRGVVGVALQRSAPCGGAGELRLHLPALQLRLVTAVLRPPEASQRPLRHHALVPGFPQPHPEGELVRGRDRTGDEVQDALGLFRAGEAGQDPGGAEPRGLVEGLGVPVEKVAR